MNPVDLQREVLRPSSRIPRRLIMLSLNYPLTWACRLGFALLIPEVAQLDAEREQLAQKIQHLKDRQPEITRKEL